VLTQDFPRTTVPQYLREEGDTELAVTTPVPGSRCDRWPAVTVAAAIMTTHNLTRACNAMQQCSPCYAGSGQGGNGQHPPVCISYPQPGDSRHRQHQEAHRIRSRIDQLLEALDLPRCLSIVQANRPVDRRRAQSVTNSVCEDCGGSICSICKKCHFCEDVDLPCAGVLRHRIHQGEAHHAHSGIPSAFRFLKMPGAVEARPFWVWQEPENKPTRQLQTAQRLEQPPFLIAEQRGRFVLMRWGDIYETPRCLWQQSGSTTMQGGAA
jgi:hypothetical protein